MHQIFPDEGLDEQLQRILNGEVRYHLFTNNIMPDRGTVLADLLEGAWPGYASQLLDLADFPTNDIVAHTARRTGPPIVFAADTGETGNAYGYYVTDSGSTILLSIARYDDGPVEITEESPLSVAVVWGGFSRFAS